MIPLALVKAGLTVAGLARTWWKAGLGAVLVFPLAFGLGQCSGERKADVRHAQAAELAQAKADVTNAQSHTVAAGERAADTHETRQTEQELRRADDAIPDTRPSDSRRAYLCARMRDQAARGGPAAPADCGPGR